MKSYPTAMLQNGELPTPHTDLAQCRKTLSGGSRSFWAASQLLPGSLRNSACGLYAFCREADDAIDDGDDPTAALAVLHERLDRVYAGTVGRNPTDRVLSRVVAEHGLPRELLNALLEGFEWDASGKRYETQSDVYAYSARVAGAVGVMMSVLMGVREANALARAADLGVAMQITNICRDVGEDARADRIYLPLKLLQAAGLDPDELLSNPTFTPQLGGVINDMLDDADRLYRRSESGIPSLPGGAQLGIYAARLLYAGIGDRLRELDCNSIDQRAILGRAGKLRRIVQTAGVVAMGTRDLDEPALPECQFLIDAVERAPAPEANDQLDDSTLGNFYQRMVWTLDMLAVLEQRTLQAQANKTASRR